MDNAKKMACSLFYRPKDERFDEKIRQFQGCPTIATTPKGRIYLGWYSGGTCEPHVDNYNLLVYSDDDGKTWSEPLLVIESNEDILVQAFDIQLWTDPQGRLHVYWIQNNIEIAPENIENPNPKLPLVMDSGNPLQPLVIVGKYLYGDCEHACWEVVCENPDDKNPQFSEPRYLGIGSLRCKPVALANGTWLGFPYDQIDDRYAYTISKDGGKTYERRYGVEKITTHFDEAMAYQKKDGSIRMLARTWLGELAESYSYDNGETWTKAILSGIVNSHTRFYVSRTPSGRVLLVTNDDRNKRNNMTISLSEDDGKTWPYKRCIDTRDWISYPDVDFFGDKIYLTYDRDRVKEREVLFAVFTEEDIINDTIAPVRIISKA